MTQDKMTTVFVYGTLKKGFGNNRLLTTSEFVGHATTVGNFLMLDGGFPVVLEAADDGSTSNRQVRGEVYEVDCATLKRLDRLESKGTMYDREIVHVRVDGRAEKIEANIYIGCDQWRRHIAYDLSSKIDGEGNYDWKY
jgi:gamma-glutamylaminecyclotransferase